MERIIIATITQYGYITDTYKYCINLSKQYDITYICLDNKLEKFYTDGINVIYIKKTKSMLLNLIMLNLTIVKENFLKRPKVIFSVYNPLNFISRILSFNTRMILDIRTGDVNKNRLRRDKANRRIKFNSLFFKEITIISKSLADLLGIKNYKVLPLGTDYIEENINKKFEKFNILYIGVLSNRNIHITMDAVEKFNQKYKGKIEIQYNIIGYFSNDNTKEVNEFFSKINKSKCIKYLGRKKYTELKEFLNKSNIGVSFIPITEYYNCQPPTKTFEYLSEGLVTIATKTYENKKIINYKNGILCDDNEQSFYNALEELYTNKLSFDSNEIKSSVLKYDWKNIVENTLVPIIEKNLI